MTSSTAAGTSHTWTCARTTKTTTCRALLPQIRPDVWWSALGSALQRWITPTPILRSTIRYSVKITSATNAILIRETFHGFGRRAGRVPSHRHTVLYNVKCKMENTLALPYYINYFPFFKIVHGPTAGGALTFHSRLVSPSFLNYCSNRASCGSRIRI